MTLLKKTTLALGLSFSLFFQAPAAQAFSLQDLATQATQSTQSSSQGFNLWNVLLGLLLGNLLGNNDSSPINQVLGITSGSTSAPTTATTDKTSSSTTKADAIITTAKKYLGVPYVFGGETTAGWDCSAFTRQVMKENGITLPRTAAEQYELGQPIDKTNLQKGDMVFFTTYKPGASHVGFYMGNGQFIHASSAAGQVTISSLNETYYTEHYIGARRYF